MRKKLSHYSARAKTYVQEAPRAKALAALPDQLRSCRAGEDEETNDLVLRELLRWFKGEFFRWTNTLACSACGATDTTSDGMLDPTEEELRDGTDRIEAHKCQQCNTVTRFPRYGDPVKLLQTRHGRCGEWANCFTLLAAALGYEARLVLDWTDHVWTEVYGRGGWRHCDPCEARLDSPLLYEAGWGKKLTYIVAFGPSEVVDVTARYTASWPDVITRRTLVSEEVFSAMVSHADTEARAGASGADSPPPWREAEDAELSRRRGNKPLAQPSSAERLGRQTGSLEWRRARGELGTTVAVLQDPSSLTFRFDPASSHTESNVLACLSEGATLCSVCGVCAVDLTAPGASVQVEICQEHQDAFCMDGGREGFTVEAWVLVGASVDGLRVNNLQEQGFLNPIVSHHGAASGWELRLLRGGGVCFLITLDGVHHEVEGTPTESGGWTGWTHVAGTFDGKSVSVFVGGQMVGDRVVPPGAWCPFSGPFCLGRNPVWCDRSTCCVLQAVRLSQVVLSEEKDFLPPPCVDSRSTAVLQQSSSLTFHFDPASLSAESTVVACLSEGAKLFSSTVGGVCAVDLTVPGSHVEVEGLSECEDIFCMDGGSKGFTVEAWVLVGASVDGLRINNLQEQGFLNPVVSHHGAASGWELRLLRGGGVCFLITIDGVHHEVEGTPTESGGWTGWTHVAGTFDGKRVCVFVGGQMVGDRVVPPGARSRFSGPLCFGQNPVWRDRSTGCFLHAVRISQTALSQEKDFLPSPSAVYG